MNGRRNGFGSLLDLERDERAQLRNPPRTGGLLFADAVLIAVVLGWLTWRGDGWWG